MQATFVHDRSSRQDKFWDFTGKIWAANGIQPESMDEFEQKASEAAVSYKAQKEIGHV